MRIGLMVVCGLTVGLAKADDASFDNLCHEQATWDRIEALRQKVPDDSLVIRGYALRLGICRLIEEKKLTLERGTEIFELERRRLFAERVQEEARKNQPRSIPAEDLEPQG